MAKSRVRVETVRCYRAHGLMFSIRYG